MLLIEESVTFDDIKQILQCNNCSYTREIMDAKSKNKYGFSYNCNQIESIFYGTQNTNNESKLKLSDSLEYIIIGSITLILICILIISIKKTSKSTINDAPLIQNNE